MIFLVLALLSWRKPQFNLEERLATDGEALAERLREYTARKKRQTLLARLHQENQQDQAEIAVCDEQINFLMKKEDEFRQKALAVAGSGSERNGGESAGAMFNQRYAWAEDEAEYDAAEVDLEIAQIEAEVEAEAGPAEASLNFTPAQSPSQQAEEAGFPFSPSYFNSAPAPTTIAEPELAQLGDFNPDLDVDVDLEGDWQWNEGEGESNEVAENNEALTSNLAQFEPNESALGLAVAATPPPVVVQAQDELDLLLEELQQAGVGGINSPIPALALPPLSESEKEGPNQSQSQVESEGGANAPAPEPELDEIDLLLAELASPAGSIPLSRGSLLRSRGEKGK